MKKVREGYKMTEIGEIPNEWHIEVLGECSNVTKLAGFEFTEYMEYIDDGEIIALRALNLKNGKLNLEDIKKIDRNVSEGLTRSKLYINDVLFSYVGTVGEVALIEENDKFHLAPNVAKITFNDLIVPKFALQYLTSSNMKNEINKYVTTTSQPALSMENIRKLKMIVPTIKEQEKIASILSTVDEQIDNVDGLIEKNKELKKGLMQRLLTKGIGHTKFKKTEIGEIPEEWEVVTISEITDVRDGTHDSPKYLESGIPFITSKNLKENKIDFSEVNFISEEDHIKFSQRSNVENGDILFGMIGTIGSPVIVNKEFEFSIKNVALIKFNKSSINNKYILNLLKSSIIENQFLKLSNGGVQKFIALSMIRELKIPVPKVEEQERIASILSEVDKKIEKYENKKEKLEELKKGLMQQLLTGKIRV